MDGKAAVIASIIIRSYNEEKWLGSLLDALGQQDFPSTSVEVILVDSGSTDGTVSIATKAGCVIRHIPKDEFTFGRSLNLGCSAANGNVLVFISAHCIPVDSDWLKKMIQPLETGQFHYGYGRQIGHVLTRFSEKQLFAKYFPASSGEAQGGIFCNNANAAILRDVWANVRFDEELTGLEDMELASRLLKAGFRLGYVPDAPVFHIHEESWAKIRTRYEREAIALQTIMPEVHVHFTDFLRYFLSAILHDASEALQQRCFLREIPGIVVFRFMQYWGSYRGNNDHRRVSRMRKERYFYPK